MAIAPTWTAAPCVHVGSDARWTERYSPAGARYILQKSPPLGDQKEEISKKMRGKEKRKEREAPVLLPLRMSDEE